MSGKLDPTLLDRARAAASRGGWAEAYALLVEAETGGLLGPADLPLLADVAYALICHARQNGDRDGEPAREAQFLSRLLEPEDCGRVE